MNWWSSTSFLAETRFAHPAANLSPVARRAQIDEMRLLIRARISSALTATPAFLVVEPRKHIRETLTRLLGAACVNGPPRMLVLSEPDHFRYRQMSDAWLAIAAIDEDRYETVHEFGAITRRFPHALIVGREPHLSEASRGPLYDLGLTLFLGEHELTNTLPALIDHVRFRRRTLPARLEREILRRHVSHRFGADGLADAKLEMSETECPTFHQVERQLIMRALRVAGGCRANAARILDMSRTTLYRRLATHDLHHYYPKAQSK